LYCHLVAVALCCQSMAVTDAGEARIAANPLRELASGIDALYLSGRTAVAEAFLDELEARKCDAQEINGPMTVIVGGEEFGLLPYALNRYRFRLSHPFGEIGITRSEHLPQIHVEPRAEFLHGLGAAEGAQWFMEVLESEFGSIEWTVNRLDLFMDVQGWELDGDDRRNFVTQARARMLREEDDGFSGLQHGTRKAGTIHCRIYDKLRQIKAKGNDYWFGVWGDTFDPHNSVLRIEFEFARGGLRDFEVDSPADALAKAGALWAAVTGDWLTHRTPTGDGTRSRWPLSPEWEFVQKASVCGGAIGLDRVRAGKRAGSIRRKVPVFVGYLVDLATEFDATSLDGALGIARALVEEDESRRDVQFAHRLEIARAERRYR